MTEAFHVTLKFHLNALFKFNSYSYVLIIFSEIGPNDIALLHTSSPFKFTKYVKPAQLPIHPKTTYKHPLKLTGWGVLRTTAFFPDLPRNLQEVNVTYLPYNGESKKQTYNSSLPEM